MLSRRILTLTLTALVSTSALGTPSTPTFSISIQGPTSGVNDSFTGVPIDGGHILTPWPPGPPGPNPPAAGPLPPPGIAGMPPRAIPAMVPGLTSLREVDAMSYGRDFEIIGGQPHHAVVFSVDEFAVGLPGFPPLNVFSEGAVGNAEASADVFSARTPGGLVGNIQPGFPGPFGNRDIIDGNGLPPFGGPGLGLIEPNPPAPGAPDPGDNLDAVDVNTSPADLTGPLYFSMDSAFVDPLEGPLTGTALLNGFVGADVVVESGPGSPLARYAAAAVLGLDLVGGPDSDDLDALLLAENGDGAFTPSLRPLDWVGGMTDMLLFSVRRGSAVIGMPDSIWGAPIEEGDILTTPVVGGLSPFPGIAVPAEWLGLATVRTGTAGPFGFGDELDSLDNVLEPPILALLAVGAVGLGVARRRERARASANLSCR